MIFSLAILGSFLLYLVIGAVVSRTIKNKDDYYVSGRNAPTVLVGGTLVASFLSTVSFMGELGFSYDGYATVMLVLTPINICGYVIGVALFGRYLRRSQALTVPEFFGLRFNSKGIQAIAGLTVIIGIGFYLIAVTQGLMLIIGQLTGLNEWQSLLLVWAGYTIFTMMSGARGILINDTIMYFFFTAAAVGGMSWIFYRAGGPSAAVEKMWSLPDRPDALTWHGLTGPDAYMGSPLQVFIYAITLGIVWMLVVAISPWQSSRYLMAKNEHVSLRSGLMATASLALIYVFLTFGGLAISLFNPDIEPSEVAFIWAAQNLMPPVLGVIAVTGIVAAGLSSAAAFLSLIGFSLDNDVMPWIASRRPAVQPKHGGIRLTRIAMASVAVAVLLITLVAPPAVLTIGYFAATLFAASWGPVALWSIQSSKITRRGATWGIIVGFLAVGFLEGIQKFGGITLPTLANPVLLGISASIIAIILGNVGQPHDPKAVAFLHSLREVPPENKSRLETRRTGIWVIVTVATLILCSALMLVFYALPTF
ncbi:sodium:solute symporter [Brevibacterium luteolum]|uniref:sodium:solute symporter n=1 Tax=Brevibacterium luteolum TaxID=199591 RepID=UPI00387933B4